jgi:uncharacterized protein YndB with AHSA1/START domain
MVMADLTLVVRRTIDATPERLFAAWTVPAQLVAWWGPAPVQCLGAEVDLRVGGAYRIRNGLPDGSELVIAGTFERIEPPSLLVYSWQVRGEPVSRVTVQFLAAAAGTDVIVTHERIADATVKDDHERGWIGCFDRLAVYATLPA